MRRRLASVAPAAVRASSVLAALAVRWRATFESEAGRGRRAGDDGRHTDAVTNGRHAALEGSMPNCGRVLLRQMPHRPCLHLRLSLSLREPPTARTLDIQSRRTAVLAVMLSLQGGGPRFHLPHANGRQLARCRVLSGMAPAACARSKDPCSTYSGRSTGIKSKAHPARAAASAAPINSSSTMRTRS